jgi:proline iminopeptidase
MIDYLDYSTRDDRLSGGVKLIPIDTPSGTFRVWTKRIGNNPRKKMLLLHGGPGVSHEYLEAFDGWFPGAEIEYYYYDQLGSFYSDQPDDLEPLLDLDRFVDEVEQVRRALSLHSENFYLYGQSWGGLLALSMKERKPSNVNPPGVENRFERFLILTTFSSGARIRGGPRAAGARPCGT